VVWSCVEDGVELDIVIAGGTIVDGTGSPGYRADVGIKGEKVESIGNLGAARARTRIDADGHIVCPGFIDPHNHAHNEAAGGILSIPGADNQVRQGVTTLIAGNCGGSPWPIAEHLDAVDKVAIRQNYATLAGFSTIREQAIPAERLLAPAAPDDIRSMRLLLDRALDEGALGLSTGYFPAFVSTDEIAEVSQSLRARRGVYSSHIRNEGDGLLGAVEEVLTIGMRAGVPVQISHIKTYGSRNWWKVDAVLGLLDHGLARGVDVRADRYPYTACFTGILGTVPMWLRSQARARGGYHSLRDADWAADVRRAVEDQLGLIGGASNILLAPLDPVPELDGRRLDEYAVSRGLDAVDAAVELIIRGGVSCIYFVMDEDNIAAFYRHPLVMVGSDGHLRRHGEGVSHPRNYGTFPRFLGRYARDRALLTVEEAVRKCTSVAAERWGLAGRGVLRPGAWADVVVFSWEGVRDRATFEDQHRYPEGIPWVLVNGKVAVENGRTAEGSWGRVIRRGG
jgi:N-acyl-D-amino-acid deacylase